jgi:hypothetical protein
MKIKSLIIFFIIYSFLCGMCKSQWTKVSNGIAAYENTYALIYNGNSIFAGTDINGVYKSTNNGASWVQLGLHYQLVKSLASNGSNIFAGTYNGVFLSTNNGNSWVQTTLNNIHVLSLALNGNNIFAGTYGNGVFLSTNNGAAWTQTSLNNQYIYSLAINGNNIFAGGYGVFLSTDNGSSWTQTSLNNQSVSSFAISGNYIFAGTIGSGVYLSTNNGSNWVHTSLGNQIIIYSLACIGSNIFAGTASFNNSFFVSNNNGADWIQKNEGLNGITVNALSIANNFLFAGTDDSGVYRRPVGELIGIKKISNQVPEKFSLSQNYPNPFNPSTKIKFDIPVDSRFRGNDNVVLKIYDILGREVVTLVNEKLQPGTYEVEWDASNYPSGVYFYKLITNSFNQTKRMVLIK